MRAAELACDAAAHGVTRERRLIDLDLLHLAVRAERHEDVPTARRAVGFLARLVVHAAQRGRGRAAIERLAGGLAETVPAEAHGRVQAAAAVALAYAAASPETAITAALTQLSGSGGLLRDARVVVLSAGQLADAAAEIPGDAGNTAYTPAAEYLRRSLGLS